MFQGILYALAACLIWGLIFIVPLFSPTFSSLEIAIGRYVVYTTISCVMLYRGITSTISRAVWFKALYFSLVCTFGYYLFLILGLRYATAEVAALIVGLSPITISYYGNWRKPQSGSCSLIVPSLLIIAGLLIINIPKLYESVEPVNIFLGIVCAFISLALWSWYVVANSEFLRNHSEVNSSDWATLVGAVTLFWIVLIGSISAYFFPEQFNISKFGAFNNELVAFILGSLALGLLCSWLGAYLWNRASLVLPVTLAGQLTIFETIFGIIYVYIHYQCLPSWTDSAGISLFLIAVIYAIRKNMQQTEALSSH